MDPADVALRIEHTLLKPEATPDQVDRLCDEAVEYRFGGVCINPVFVRRVAKRLDQSAGEHRPTIVAVAGFPLGAHRTDMKVAEAHRALEDGAQEIDMVIWLGALIAGNHEVVRDDIHEVAKVCHMSRPSARLKVIIEAAALTDDQVTAACRLCAEGEADFVKTSTGFHPAGGATVEHVRMMRRLSAPMKVKAAGGIRDGATALAMIDAGADRLGCSSSVQIIRELQAR